MWRGQSTGAELSLFIYYRSHSGKSLSSRDRSWRLVIRCMQYGRPTLATAGLPVVLLCSRLRRLKETLEVIGQTEQSMRRLRRWLISTENQLSTPLIFQHADFTEIQQHLSRLQVSDLRRVHSDIIGCLHNRANIEQTSSKHRAGSSRPIGTPPLAQPRLRLLAHS